MAQQGYVGRDGAPKLNFVTFPGARSQITITMISIHPFNPSIIEFFNDKVLLLQVLVVLVEKALL